MRISFFDKITASFPEKSISLNKALRDIQQGKYKEQIKNIRVLANDKAKRDVEKKKLPLVTFCGVFDKRSNNALKQYSGFACLDFDNVTDLRLLIENVNKDKYTYASFISPSGNGLKVLVQTPSVDNDKDYKSFYFKIQEHYNQYGETDEATKDIARATFFSYDPNLFVNTENEIFTDRLVPKEIAPIKPVVFKVDDDNEIAERLIKWFKKHWTTGINRNNNLFKLCSAFNDYGVNKSIALDYCSQYQRDDFKIREIEKLVDSAYKNTFNFGTKVFEDTNLREKTKRLLFSGNTQQQIKEKLDINYDLTDAIEGLEQEIPKDTFWEIDEKGRVSISFLRFDYYLRNLGVSKYYPNKLSRDFDFIIKDSNFIDWIDTTRIKDIVKKDIVSRGCFEVWDYMAKNSSIFKKESLSMIDTIDVSTNKDTADTSYIYYKNKIVKTTKERIELLDYKDIDSLVWSKQVIDRDITLSENSDGEFRQFIWFLSAQNADRYYTLKSVIGYLLHSYQLDAEPKSIVFNDEMLSDDIPNGGSGKGLIHKAIGQLKNICTEDGKRFDPKNQFAYQRVSEDTQIFLIDDVPKSFNFENLFSIITEGITIEKKGKDPFKIPFNLSPKLSLTTNYTLRGDGASHYRRIFEVEIANYFNDKHTPFDEFGHSFFFDWDNEEWCKFDNFMIRCIQYYLENGLVESNKVNLELRKLRNNLGFEFLEFMDTLPFKEKKSKKDVREDFNIQYRNIAKYNSPQKFNKKVKDYCDFYGFELIESKYNGVDTWQIIREDNNVEGDDCPF